MITLIDVDAAAAELCRVLDADARIVCIKGGPAHTPSGFISPADTRFDPFWGLVNESGVTVGIHSGDAGYGRYLNDWEPSGDFEAFRFSPLRTVLSSDRPPFETMAAFLCQGLFDRFPRVRVASIESGASWVSVLIKKLKKAYAQMPGSFRSDPIEKLRQHIWIAPFYEDNLSQLKEAVGTEQILFGSDWPHAEGLAEPRNFALDLRRHGVSEDEIHTVMAENGWTLTRPAS
jgi:predicted TIM-barrel fold metal-dependent hydrolase